jgi:serine/threonine protein kinase/tetratricopeptide (TPR) repeat protein
MTDEALFAAVLEHAPADRQRYLQEACGSDEALLQRLKVLLAAHEKALDILDPPVKSVASPEETGAYAPTNDIGTVISGKYKLREQIGEGGMGTVWVADQTQPVRRKVALKLIKAGMDSKTVLSRFEAERQALALMDHPNIAKVLDGGTTENGRPFFVMEYVKGIPIIQYCDEARLSIRERLDLFLPVCQAIQHAHQKGIIHRDLKPSNILICLYDGKPVPKVIDFGLAKAMHQPLTEHTLYTAHGLMMGTPLYMSPEQAEFNNLDVDTRTDIYALGVILYELLTGTTPLEKHRFKEAAFQEMLRLIKDEEPPRPSTRLSGCAALPTVAAHRGLEPVKLTKLIRGELDWIVMKCLEKDRSRRYETANGLARDVQHYLSDEPVEACPPSAGYRLRKFAGKHRLMLGTAGTIAFVLVAATTFSAWQAHRAWKAEEAARQAEAVAVQERNAANLARDAEAAARQNADVQRTQSETNFKKARQAVDEYLTKVSESKLLNVPGLQPLRKDLLESARKYYTDFLRDHGTDQSVRAESAEAWYRLGFLEMQIGTQIEAAKDFQEAERMYEGLARDYPSEARYPYKLAMALNDLGNCQGALGFHGDSLRTEERGLEIRRRVAKDNPEIAEYQKELGIGLMNCGDNKRRAGRAEEAMVLYGEAREVYERLIHAHPEIADYRYRLAGVFKGIAYIQENSGRTDDALAALAKARNLLEEVARAQPENLDVRYSLAVTLRWKGQVYQRRTNRPREAIALYQSAIGQFERLVRENPAMKSYPLELGYAYCYLGQVLRKTDRCKEAEDMSRKALVLFERIDKEGDSDPYNMACIRSLSSDLVRSSLSDANANERGDRLADRAMDALRQAIANGYHDVAWIENDTDLDPIRPREDFKKLMEELRKKTKGQASSPRANATPQP